jgi:arylsulfatase A
MVPLLLSKGEQKKHDYLYWEFFEAGGKRAILKDQWKLILYKTNTDLDPKFELFNLSKDQGETKNVASQYPEMVTELRGLMDNAHTPAESKFFKLASELKSKKK